MALEIAYFTGGARERVFEALIAAGHRISKVYVNDPRRWPRVTSTIEKARQRGIGIRIVKNKHDLDGIADEIDGSLCLSVGFNYLLPARFLKKSKICLNVHGSLLPKYRGARTLPWVVENGEHESGVTIHVVDQGIDTGPILLQRSFPLSPFETTRSLARKTAEFEPAVVVEALKLYEAVGLSVCRPQPVIDLKTYANRVPSHSEVDANSTLMELFDKIRAADPDRFPAYFRVHGQVVCIRLWRPDKPADEVDLI